MGKDISQDQYWTSKNQGRLQKSSSSVFSCSITSHLHGIIFIMHGINVCAGDVLFKHSNDSIFKCTMQYFNGVKIVYLEAAVASLENEVREKGSSSL